MDTGLEYAGGGFLLEGKQVWLDFDEKALTLDYPPFFASRCNLIAFRVLRNSLGRRWHFRAFLAIARGYAPWDNHRYPNVSGIAERKHLA